MSSFGGLRVVVIVASGSVIRSSRPTWDGYMKPAAAQAVDLGKKRVRTFEEMEIRDFSGCPRTKSPVPLLRVHAINDPIVRPQVLYEAGMHNVEFWWTARGGHCGQWLSYPKLAAAIASWSESQ